MDDCMYDFALAARDQIMTSKHVSTASAAAIVIFKGRWMTPTWQELLQKMGIQQLKYQSLMIE